MFRSLPNFISHKRAYCLRPAPPLERILHNNQLPEYYSNIEAIEVNNLKIFLCQIIKNLCRMSWGVEISTKLPCASPKRRRFLELRASGEKTLKRRRMLPIIQRLLIASRVEGQRVLSIQLFWRLSLERVRPFPKLSRCVLHFCN
jgi:hypothetical protein